MGEVARHDERLTARLRRWAHERAAKTAFTFLRDGREEASLTYGMLADRVARAAGALQRDCAPGDRALLICPPGIDFIVAFLACLQVGVIAVPVNIPKPRRLAWRRLAAIAEDSRAGLILTVAETRAQFDKWFDGEPALAGLTRRDIGTMSDDTVPASAIADQDVAFLQYTSGSTGTPKGVVVTHANLVHNEALIEEAFGHDADTVIVSWLPLFHDLGLIGNVLQTIHLGAICHLMAPSAFVQNPARWLEAISRYRATTAMAPNFAYDRCVDSVSESDLAGLDLSSWKVALNGAEPIRAETIRRFEERFGPYGFSARASFPAYGLAEATLIVSTSDRGSGAIVRSANEVLDDPGPLDGSLVSSGAVRGGMDVAIVDEECCRRLGEGQAGELWVRGASVAQGYWQRPIETRDTFQAELADGSGPFLRTGDIAALRDGRIYILGRSKELIIIRGQNIYPQDVEYVAQQACPVMRPDCGAAFSIEVAGEERLFLVQEIERTAMRGLDGAAVAAAARRATAEAFDVELWGLILIRPASLPKTSSGKIQRRACAAIEEADGFDAVFRSVREAPTAASTAAFANAHAPLALPDIRDRTSVVDWLSARVALYLGIEPEAIDPEAILADYGLDSSMAVSLAGDVAQLTASEDDPGLVWTYPTILALADHIDETAYAEARSP